MLCSAWLLTMLFTVRVNSRDVESGLREVTGQKKAFPDGQVK